MAPSFISQLITSKGGEHGGPAATATGAAATTTTGTTTGATIGTPARSLPPGFTGTTGFGAGFAGIGASPAGIGATQRLPMRANLGLPMTLQMPRTFPSAPMATAATPATTTTTAAPPGIPVIPNMKRQVTTDSESAASTSSSSSASSSSSGSPPAAPAPTPQRWNDAEKMQDFFLHIKKPENFAQAENKLINIRELVAKNASPLERFAAEHPAQDFSIKDDAPAPAEQNNSAKAHNALSDMLAARTPPMMATPKKESSNQDDNHRRPALGDSRGNMLAEMLAKRGGGEQPEQTQPAKKQVPSTPSGDARGNMLAEMLAKRGGGDSNQPAKAVPTKPSAGGDPRSNMLGEMLAKRGQPTPAKESSSSGGGGDARGNMLAEMLAKRGGGGSAKSEVDKLKSNPIADMLSKRAAPSSEPKSNPIADMLAKRAAPSSQSKGEGSPDSKSSSSNPLAAMLKRRFATKGEESASNPQEPQREEASAAAPAPPNVVLLKDDPKYGKYFKMLKIGHPAPVVKHRMQRDGADPAILDLDPNKPLSEQQSGDGGDSEAERVFQEQLAEYKAKIGKYTQMLKVGLPRPVVEHKMQMEGVNPAWLDGPPTKQAKQQQQQPAAPTEEEIAAHRAKYDKYFAMLRVGLPRGAVEHKMMMAGIDPKELDGPRPVASAASSAASSPATPASQPFKRSNSIRKKIHWEVKRVPTHQRSSSRDSLWNFQMEDDAMDEIRISLESKEMLEKLFVKTISDTPKKKPAKKASDSPGGDDATKKKQQLIVLIDMKKSQNIAITLARVKMGFPELKREILAMNPTVLSTAQLQSLMDMWPDKTEQEAINNFHGDMNLLGTVCLMRLYSVLCALDWTKGSDV